MDSQSPAVLLDVDGTLVDTCYLHALAWFRSLRDAGITVPTWRLHRLIGMGADQLLQTLLSDERPDLEEGWSSHFEQLKDDAVALPGASDLLRMLKRQGGIVVLATSGQPDDVEHMQALIGADDAIDHVVNSSEVESSKPAPDIFRLALERAGAPAERALAVGDTVWDVQAAQACGVDCIGVLTGGISRAELLEAGAVAVYADAAELCAQFATSPLARLFRR